MPASPPQPAKRETAATIVAASDDTVTIAVDAPVSGVLVLHDLFYPGWEVRVDGARAPLLKADLLFRGVVVPSGHHTVEFGFHPFSLANLAAAVGGLLHGTGG